MKNMDCKKTQQLYDDMTDGRVAEPVASELRRHLDECTDCRVLRQRAGRLQQLLALKRHEQPPPGYFNNFTAEFHRRLLRDTQRPTWMQRIAESFRVEVTPVWRYALAGVCGAALAFGLVWKISPHNTATVAASEHAAPVKTVAAATPSDESVVVSRTPALAVMPAAWHPDANRPQYVLERIAITPASYETASVRF
jgi:predicted anti-sigma-YlaC factor YlaD